MNTVPYKKQYSLNERMAEFQRIKKIYPDVIPVICERGNIINYKIPHIVKSKYLVHPDLTVGHFMCVIRSRLQLEQSTAIYFVVGACIIPSYNRTIGELYEDWAEHDGFLYIKYCGENTFG